MTREWLAGWLKRERPEAPTKARKSTPKKSAVDPFNDPSDPEPDDDNSPEHGAWVKRCTNKYLAHTWPRIPEKFREFVDNWEPVAEEYGLDIAEVFRDFEHSGATFTPNMFEQYFNARLGRAMKAA